MKQPQPPQVKPRFLRIDQVEDLTSISRSHIYYLASLGEFPRLVTVFGRIALVGSRGAGLDVETPRNQKRRGCVISARDMEVAGNPRSVLVLSAPATKGGRLAPYAAEVLMAMTDQRSPEVHLFAGADCGSERWGGVSNWARAQPLCSRMTSPLKR